MFRHILRRMKSEADHRLMQTKQPHVSPHITETLQLIGLNPDNV